MNEKKIMSEYHIMFFNKIFYIFTMKINVCEIYYFVILITIKEFIYYLTFRVKILNLWAQNF